VISFIPQEETRCTGFQECLEAGNEGGSGVASNNANESLAVKADATTLPCAWPSTCFAIVHTKRSANEIYHIDVVTGW
jgi:hypothetical protein